jgi:hypothetical protein
MSLADQFKGELATLKKAPLTFTIGFVVLAVLIGWTEYSLLFKELFAYKNSQIQTLREQLLSTKGAKGKTEEPPKPGPTSVGAATANGPESTANTGTIGTINYGGPKTPSIPKTKRK